MALALYRTKSERITEEFIADFGSLFLSSYFGTITPRIMESFAIRVQTLTGAIRSDKRFKRGRLHYQPYIEEAIRAVKYLLIQQKFRV